MLLGQVRRALTADKVVAATQGAEEVTAAGLDAQAYMGCRVPLHVWLVSTRDEQLTFPLGWLQVTVRPL